MIRNAGGRATDDALRSLVISHKLCVGGHARAHAQPSQQASHLSPSPYPCPNSCAPPNRLGTKEWFVVHHTDCGMEYYTGEQMATLLETSLATANIVAGEGPKGVVFQNASSEGGSKLGHSVHWGCITDQAASVREDVERISKYELVAAGIPVHGYVYDVKTGKLVHVVSAVTKA